MAILQKALVQSISESLAVMIVFGSSIKSINLVLLLVIIQMVYLGVLIYLDGYYEDHHKAADWKKIQHS